MCPEACADCTGLEQVLVRYCWNGENWRQTTQAIDRLRRELSAAIGIRDANSREQECLRVCLNIVRWGGERSSKVGASLFLTYVWRITDFRDKSAIRHTHVSEHRYAILLAAITRVARIYLDKDRLIVAARANTPRQIPAMVRPEIQAVVDACHRHAERNLSKLSKNDP
jgi:hypothetical protein